VRRANRVDSCSRCLAVRAAHAVRRPAAAPTLIATPLANSD
jgi:hypothetical protein